MGGMFKTIMAIVLAGDPRFGLRDGRPRKRIGPTPARAQSARSAPPQVILGTAY